METYVLIDDAPFRLRVRSGELPRFGVFFFTRLLWRIYPTGGHWTAHSVFYFVLILATLLMFVLDLIVLIIYGLFYAARWAIIGLGVLLWRLTERLFSAVIYPSLRSAIILIIITILLIILVYRFDTIRDLILKAFDHLTH